MNPAIGVLESAARIVVAVLLNGLWEAAVIAAIAWIVLRVVRDASAATRYVIWCIALFAAMLLPLVTTLTQVHAGAQPHPTVTVTKPSIVAAPSSAIQAAQTKPVTSRPVTSQPVATGPALVPAHLERPHIELPNLAASVAFALWGVVALALLARLAFAFAKLESLKRDALPVPVAYRDRLARWLGASKGTRDVRLCTIDEIDVPVAVGIFDSMILLPKHLFEALSDDEVDRITIHELAHLRRGDDWVNGVQRVAEALLFFNPAIRWIAHHLDIEREVACDDWVLAATSDVKPYAFCLTKMAEITAWPHKALPAPGVFVTRRSLSIRVERLLHSGRNVATQISPAATFAILVLIAAFGIALQFVTPSIAFAPDQAVIVPTVAHASAEPTRVHDEARRFFDQVLSGRLDYASMGYGNISAQDRANLDAIAQRVRRLGPVESLTFLGVSAGVNHETWYHYAVAQRRGPSILALAVGTNGRTTGVQFGTEDNVIARDGNVTTSPAPVRYAAAHLGEIPEPPVIVPGQDVHVPAQDIHVPGQDVHIPAIDVHVPAINVHVPQVHVNVSQVQVNCASCSLEHVDWSGRDLSSATFQGADFEHATLHHVNFSKATIIGSDFEHSNLRGANFSSAQLSGCDFQNATLGGAIFTGASISGCDFSGQALEPSQARDILSTCSGCDFSRANLRHVDLSNVRPNGQDWSGADLEGANLSGAVLTSIDLSRVNLSGANLNGTVFQHCDFSNVNVSGVDISKAHFVDTVLSGAVNR